MQSLSERGGDTDTKDDDTDEGYIGQTLRHEAVRSLPDISVRERNILTPLHRAVDREKFTVAESFLECGEVDVRDQLNWKPLHVASQQGHLGLVQLLLDHGADVFARSNEGRTALHMASEHGDPEILRFLISRGANPNARSKDQETALFLASRKGRLEAPRLLSKHSTDIDSHDLLGRTPLHIAAETYT